MLKHVNVVSLVLVLLALASVLAAVKVGHGQGTYGFFSGG